MLLIVEPVKTKLLPVEMDMLLVMNVHPNMIPTTADKETVNVLPSATFIALWKTLTAVDAWRNEQLLQSMLLPRFSEKVMVSNKTA